MFHEVLWFVSEATALETGATVGMLTRLLKVDHCGNTSTDGGGENRAQVCTKGKNNTEKRHKPNV